MSAVQVCVCVCPLRQKVAEGAGGQPLKPRYQVTVLSAVEPDIEEGLQVRVVSPTSTWRLAVPEKRIATGSRRLVAQ